MTKWYVLHSFLGKKNFQPSLPQRQHWPANSRKKGCRECTVIPAPSKTGTGPSGSSSPLLGEWVEGRAPLGKEPLEQPRAAGLWGSTQHVIVAPFGYLVKKHPIRLCYLTGEETECAGLGPSCILVLAWQLSGWVPLDSVLFEQSWILKQQNQKLGFLIGSNPDIQVFWENSDTYLNVHGASLARFSIPLLLHCLFVCCCSFVGLL